MSKFSCWLSCRQCRPVSWSEIKKRDHEIFPWWWIVKQRNKKQSPLMAPNVLTHETTFKISIFFMGIGMVGNFSKTPGSVLSLLLFVWKGVLPATELFPKSTTAIEKPSRAVQSIVSKFHGDLLLSINSLWLNTRICTWMHWVTRLGQWGLYNFPLKLVNEAHENTGHGFVWQDACSAHSKPQHSKKNKTHRF